MTAWTPQPVDGGEFIAINQIQVRTDYRERMEHLFQTRARSVGQRPGFLSMEVLRPARDDDPYRVISRWRSRDDFEAWANDSEEFREGHRHAMADLAAARGRRGAANAVDLSPVYRPGPVSLRIKRPGNSGHDGQPDSWHVLRRQRLATGTLDPMGTPAYSARLVVLYDQGFRLEVVDNVGHMSTRQEPGARMLVDRIRLALDARPHAAATARPRD